MEADASTRFFEWCLCRKAGMMIARPALLLENYCFHAVQPTRTRGTLTRGRQWQMPSAQVLTR